LITSVLSYEILDVWINQEFAENGSPILQLLPLGILINGLAFVAFALVQSTRPDMIAKLAAIELPTYLGVLWLLLQADGIRGAAIGFVLRALFDTTMLYYFTHRLGLVRPQLLFRIGRMVAVGVGVVALGMLLPSTATRVLYIAIVLACFFPFAWLRILTSDEKLRLGEKYRSIRSSGKLRLKRSEPDTA
jgi:O-antigen/teichoic acid export membrane protein